MKKLNLIIYLSISLTAIILNSCFIVIEETESDIAPEVTISPKPTIPISDTLIRSDLGDMIAFIPKGWFFVDLENDLSSDVMGVAVNPDYTISAVFSKIRKNPQVEELIKKESLIGLARYSLQKKQNKTGNAVKLSGKFSMLNMGMLNFCQYKFITQNSNLEARSVVFISTLNNYYEFSLVPMNITGSYLPTTKEIEQIFNSIITTIQF